MFSCAAALLDEVGLSRHGINIYVEWPHFPDFLPQLNVHATICLFTAAAWQSLLEGSRGQSAISHEGVPALAETPKA